jgi:hypothetical protein
MMQDYLALAALLFAFYAVLRCAHAHERHTSHPCWAGTALEGALLRGDYEHNWSMRYDVMGDCSTPYTMTINWLECDGCGAQDSAEEADFQDDLGYDDGWRD